MTSLTWGRLDSETLQVMARADEQGVRLSVKDLLDAPTIAGLASRTRNARVCRTLCSQRPALPSERPRDRRLGRSGALSAVADPAMVLCASPGGPQPF